MSRQKNHSLRNWFLGTVAVGLIPLSLLAANKFGFFDKGLEKKISEPVRAVQTVDINDINNINQTNYIVKQIPKDKNQDINYEGLYEMIARHEGVRHEAYSDTKGILTVGAGFNLEKPEAKKRIISLGLDYNDVCNKKQKLSENQVYSLMKEDIEIAISDAKNYVGENWDELNPRAKEIVIDMAYNLGGSKLNNFKKLRN